MRSKICATYRELEVNSSPMQKRKISERIPEVMWKTASFDSAPDNHDLEHLGLG